MPRCISCHNIKRKLKYKNSEQLRQKIKIAGQKYRKNNPELYAKHRKKTRSKSKFKNNRNAKLKEKRKVDLQFKLQENLRSRLYKATVRLQKAGSAIKDLGCSIEELKIHLQAKFYGDMTWDNYGSYWVIDHIIPLAAFDLTDREQFLKAAHYTNLQPLTEEHNQIKLDKVMTMEEMQKLKFAGV